MATTFNVLDYGATGNGVTDDTRAIQQAIDAAAKAGGGEVYVPGGTYILSGPNNDGGCLTLKSNVTLSGEHRGATTLKLADGSSGDIAGLVHTKANSNTHYATVRDLTLDGNDANTTGTVDGIVTGSATGNIAHTVGLTVAGVELQHFSGDGLRAQALTYATSVNDSLAHDNEGDGFATQFKPRQVYNDTISFNDNQAYANGGDGFDVVGAPWSSAGIPGNWIEAFRFANNDVYENAGSGIVLTAVDQPDPSRVFNAQDGILGGRVYGNAGTGITLQGFAGGTIGQVDIHHNGQEGIALLGTLQQRVYGNYVHDNAQGWPASDILVVSYTNQDGRGYASDKALELTQNTVVGGEQSTYGLDDRQALGSDNPYRAGSGNTFSNFRQGPVVTDQAYVSGVSPLPVFTVAGTDGGDHLRGTAAVEALQGGRGRDALEGGAGVDVLTGGKGADRLTGGEGNDVFMYAQRQDSYASSTGTTFDRLLDFTPGHDQLDLATLGLRGLGDGHDGTVQLVYNSTTGASYLQSLDVDTDGYRFKLGLSGDYTDRLTDADFFGRQDGTRASDTLAAERHNGELLVGHGGEDTLSGGVGNDRLEGDAGADHLSGGTGHDVFVYKNLTDSYTNEASHTQHLDVLSDFKTVEGDLIDVSALGFTGVGDGHDGTLKVTVEAITGHATVESLDTDTAGNRFVLTFENAYPDGLISGGGYALTDAFILAPHTPQTGLGDVPNQGTLLDDVVMGNDQDNVLHAGAGDDVLIGAGGADKLYGEPGADTFLYQRVSDSYSGTADLIEDFLVSADRIDVSALGFTGLGDGKAGTLALSYSATSDRTYLQANELDSDGHSFRVGLAGDFREAFTAQNVLFSVTAPVAQAAIDDAGVPLQHAEVTVLGLAEAQRAVAA